jgi:hypothetical protein
MSLQALRSGACSSQTQPQPVAVSVRVCDLTVQVDYHRTNSSSSARQPAMKKSRATPGRHHSWSEEEKSSSFGRHLELELVV